MTRDDVLRMAREAGFPVTNEPCDWIHDGNWFEEIERFAALVEAHVHRQTALWLGAKPTPEESAKAATGLGDQPNPAQST